MLRIPSRKKRPGPRLNPPSLVHTTHPSGEPHPHLFPELLFKRMICVERTRTERSRKPFLLLLLDARQLLDVDSTDTVRPSIVAALSTSTRQTDVIGWYEENAVLGTIFTELGETDKAAALGTIRAKVTAALSNRLQAEQVRQILVSYHFFPDDEPPQQRESSLNAHLYPDVQQRDDAERFPRVIKRVIDLIGSVLALTVLFPVWLVIYLSVKLTSKGPGLFRQKRVGRYGKPFTLLKFRTMVVSGDIGVHRDYARRFITGQIGSDGSGRGQNTVYKMTNDARVTRVGRLLRRTSLDEIPQFLNVLKGEMSLVGPRPPVPYELEDYHPWHRRRVLEAKPGITGLWQVTGRSKTSFEDMVRLDLRYARTWSVWLDIKILLQTLRIVFSGEGAY